MTKDAVRSYFVKLKKWPSDLIFAFGFYQFPHLANCFDLSGNKPAVAVSALVQPALTSPKYLFLFKPLTLCRCSS